MSVSREEREDVMSQQRLEVVDAEHAPPVQEATLIRSALDEVVAAGPTLPQTN